MKLSSRHANKRYSSGSSPRRSAALGCPSEPLRVPTPARLRCAQLPFSRPAPPFGARLGATPGVDGTAPAPSASLRARVRVVRAPRYRRGTGARCPRRRAGERGTPRGLPGAAQRPGGGHRGARGRRARETPGRRRVRRAGGVARGRGRSVRLGPAVGRRGFRRGRGTVQQARGRAVPSTRPQGGSALGGVRCACARAGGRAAPRLGLGDGEPRLVL